MRQKIWDFFAGVNRVLFVGKAAMWNALFTCLLTVITYKVYQIYVLINDTSQSSERAFVTFIAPQVGPRIVNNPTDLTSSWTAQEVEMYWNNTGVTAARDVIVTANSNSFFPNLPATYDFPIDAASKQQIVLGPKQTYGTNGQIGRDSIVDGWHGKRRLFIWGVALYKDVFPKSPEHLTEFCVELTHLTIGMLQQPAGITTPANQSATNNGKAATPSAPTPQDGAVKIDVDSPNALLTGFQWQQCPAHNCYDEDCPDYKDRIKEVLK